MIKFTKHRIWIQTGRITKTVFYPWSKIFLRMEKVGNPIKSSLKYNGKIHKVKLQEFVDISVPAISYWFGSDLFATKGRVLQIDFIDPIGEKSIVGNWETMLPNETPKDTLKRIEKEGKFN